MHAVQLLRARLGIDHHPSLSQAGPASERAHHHTRARTARVRGATCAHGSSPRAASKASATCAPHVRQRGLHVDTPGATATPVDRSFGDATRRARAAGTARGHSPLATTRAARGAGPRPCTVAPTPFNSL
jgi:hypothetical protein